MSSEPQRFRLRVAYDGRPYDGWQSQAGGGAVQDFLLAALQRICPTVPTVQGSGRTDAGVSAEGQVAHFDAPGGWKMSAQEWQRALNANLPPTIRIMASETAAPDFHARFSAKGKRYRYRLATGEVLPPLQAGLAWHRRGLDPGNSFAEAVEAFAGKHDFRAFSANRGDGRDEERDTVRTIFAATVERQDDFVDVRIEGSGFLYKMVRFLVGTAVYRSEGRISLAEIEALLAGSSVDAKAPFCAPPDGLLLEEVFYPE